MRLIQWWRTMTAKGCMAAMALTMGLAATAWADPPDKVNGEAVIGVSEIAPTLDGRIDADEWRNALRVDGFGADPRMARAYIMAADGYIYIGVWSQLPAEGDLLARVERDSPAMIHDDSIEVWIDPAPEAADGRRIQFMTNPLGHASSRMHTRGQYSKDPTWSAEWRTVSEVREDGWHCEMAIPVEEIAAGRDVTDGAWDIDVWRNWKNDWRQAFMGVLRVTFTDELVPVVSFRNRGVRQEGRVNYALSVFNPSDRSVSVDASFHAERDVMPEVRTSKKLEIPPGESRELVLEESDQVTNAWTVSAEVAADDGVTLFSHRTKWKATGKYEWIAGDLSLAPLDFQYAFYPSRETLKLRADVSNLPADAELERLEAIVREKNSDKVIKKVVFDDLVGGVQELETRLPGLDGEYEIALVGTGENVPDEETIKSFIRYRYPWEGANLGVTTEVYPPFTPMEVTGNEVRTVMRRHELNGAGLWDQVEAEGQNTGIAKSLLAEPMRYVVKMDGNEVALEADAPRIVSAADHEIRAVANWQADALAGEADITWEVDGMMRVDLTLQPTNGRQVDELTLEIPLREEQARLLHALGDGIRNSVNLTLPNKPGEVWTSEGIPVLEMPSNFCSLFLIGTPARALTWFAANDKGWSWDESTPNVTIQRRGEAVVARVHLINKPLVIDEPRTITFGLQAAPVKPRLGGKKWRTEMRGPWTFLLTGVNWGSYTAAASVYPPMKDTLFWKKLAWVNQHGGLPPDELDEVIAHYKPYMEQFDTGWGGTSQVEFWERHARHNLGTDRRKGQRMIYYFNRACHRLEDEFLTYQDEWALSNWRTDWEAIGKKVNHEIKIVPTGEFCNFHLNWYGKSFDIGRNEGVYWDNMFFRSSYNTETTMAYRRPDGSIRPSTGVWGLRKLVKRTFNYMAERGMQPLTMPHITSTMILPVYGFATITYDLEWKYGRGPFQTRFDREYTQIATTGELVGAWPWVLGDRNYEDKDLTPRSYTGSLLVHDVYAPQGEAGRSFLRPVRRILDEPGVKVARYWDDGPLPVDSSNDDVPWIAHYVPGKRALISLVNYTSDSAATDLKIDLRQLGFNGPVLVRDAETLKPYTLDGGVLKYVIDSGYNAKMLEVLQK